MSDASGPARASAGVRKALAVNGGKRRSENFSEAEKALLLNLVPVHLSVIEATENDVFTNRNKKLTWESITKQYNESVKEIDGPAREPHHLRGLYRRLKLMAKREYLSFKEKTTNCTLEESLSKWSRLLYELVPASVESLHKERQMGHSSGAISPPGSHGAKSRADTEVSAVIQQETGNLLDSLTLVRPFTVTPSLETIAKKPRLKSDLSECSNSDDDGDSTHKRQQATAANSSDFGQTFSLQPMSLFEMLQIQLMTEVLNEIREIKSLLSRDKVKSNDEE